MASPRNFPRLALVLCRRCHELFVIAVAVYVSWVLLGTVAFVSHLGAQWPPLSSWLPGGGQPGGSGADAADACLDFFAWNVPVALIFVLPHSLLRVRRLTAVLSRFGLEAQARLLYNGIAAVTLHGLLCHLRPLRTPVVMEMPLPPPVHLALSLGCLALATFSFAFDKGTSALLGIAPALGQPAKPPPAGMDAITWIGECVWRRAGPWAFVLFTGVSIIPPAGTLGDVLVRAVAAVYLRLRSQGFRSWVSRVESHHGLCWVLRGCLLCAALARACQDAGSASVAARVRALGADGRVWAALAFAALLRALETRSSRVRACSDTRASTASQSSHQRWPLFQPLESMSSRAHA